MSRETAVLNRELYDLLSSFSPAGVKVSASGRPVKYSIPPAKAVQFSASLNPEHWIVVHDGGEQYAVNCPFCRDSRQRLYFSHAAGAYFIPAKSKKPLRISRYLCCCHNEQCQKRPEFKRWIQGLPFPSTDLTEAYLSGTLHPVKQQYRQIVSHQVSFPKGCRYLQDPRNPGYLLEYLVEERGFDVRELEERHLCRYAPQGTEWTNEETGEVQVFTTDRLIFPVIQRKIMVGWQARRLDHVRKMKYLNSAGGNKREWLYNMDTAVLYDDIVLCEGVTDVWRIGDNAVALFGKVFHDEQIHLMSRLWQDRGQAVILPDMNDPEAYPLAKENVEKLNRMNVFPRKAICIAPPGDDPASCSRQDLLQTVAYAREYLNRFLAENGFHEKRYADEGGEDSE